MDGDLLVTLRLDPDAQERFDALRRRWFPARRLVVGAHLMLFHALPPTEPVVETVAAACDRPVFDVAVTRVRSLGRGVAFDVTSPELLAVRTSLAESFDAVLTSQDRQRFAPHVTVQNKVDPAVARATLAALAADFVPWRATAVGLDVWTYRGGPWEPLSYEAFSTS